MKSIRQIAASLEATSTAAAKRALKDAGMKQTLAPDLLEAKAEIDSARNAKRCARAAIHRRPTGRKPVTLPVGMLAQRLETLRKTAVRCAFVRAFRQPAHGDLSIMLTDDPAKVGVVQRDYDDWNIYAKSYKKGPAKCLDNTITAPAMWRARVDKRGLAVVDGMMTLDAAVIEGAPEGVSLYAARWITQGRGNSVCVSNGYIAISNGFSYHADSAERALAGLKRKIKAAAWHAEMRAADLSEIVARLSSIVVRLSDARAIGACEYGIKSWCARVGISYEAGEATVAEVYAGYLASPAPEARGAILHAARRARKHLSLAA